MIFFSRKGGVLVSATVVTWLGVTGMAEAKSRRKDSTSSAGNFTYYVLALSYAPDFCDQPGRKDPRECAPGRHLGFVVHGLWPQAGDGRGPENCGPARPVRADLVDLMLRYMPTGSLIQHEWASHGTCSGLSPAEYFGAVRKARDSIHLPQELDQPRRQLQWNTAELKTRILEANRGWPRDAVQISCYGNRELQELRVCFNKDLSPRACGYNVGRCSAPAVTMLPVH